MCCSIANDEADVVSIDDPEEEKEETEFADDFRSTFPWGAIRLQQTNPPKYIDLKIVNGVEAKKHEFPFIVSN